MYRVVVSVVVGGFFVVFLVFGWVFVCLFACGFFPMTTYEMDGEGCFPAPPFNHQVTWEDLFLETL